MQSGGQAERSARLIDPVVNLTLEDHQDKKLEEKEQKRRAVRQCREKHYNEQKDPVSPVDDCGNREIAHELCFSFGIHRILLID